MDEVTGPVHRTDARPPPPAHRRRSLPGPDAGLHDQAGGPLTRERRIDINYLDGPPKPWCVEHELAVPEFWRDPDKVEAKEE